MAKHTLTDLKLRYIRTLLEEFEWLLKSCENTDVLSSSWRFSNEKRSGGSVTKRGVEVQ